MVSSSPGSRSLLIAAGSVPKLGATSTVILPSGVPLSGFGPVRVTLRPTLPPNPVSVTTAGAFAGVVVLTNRNIGPTLRNPLKGSACGSPTGVPDSIHCGISVFGLPFLYSTVRVSDCEPVSGHST